MAPLARDECDFASLRQAGQAYGDKTAHSQRRLAEPIKYAFLARPRRFGPSLLASTLAHWFSRADEALFQDLAIAAYVPQVPRRPVVLLDMSLGVGHTAAQVREALMPIVREPARRFGFVLRETSDTAPWVALSRLRSPLEQAYGKFVVRRPSKDRQRSGRARRIRMRPFTITISVKALARRRNSTDRPRLRRIPPRRSSPRNRTKGSL